MPMIDLHCHLLPGLDDGATDMEQSLALARIASSNGITHIVVTPHIRPAVFNNNTTSIRTAFESFQLAVQSHAIPLQLAMAAEVHICPEIIPMLAADEIPLFESSQGKRTILLEFPYSHIPPGSDKMISWLYDHDITCLIAHPERNKEIMCDIDKLTPLINMGCLLQVTAGSVAGHFGEQVNSVAIKLLERGWVNILASDAHNVKHRPPELESGRKAAAEIIGPERANDLVWKEPWSFVSGMFESPPV